MSELSKWHIIRSRTAPYINDLRQIINQGLQNGNDHMDAVSGKNTILFNASKKELFLPTSGYKTLQSRLKMHWAVGLQRDDLTLERLSPAKLVVFGGPRDKFSTSEVRLKCVKLYIVCLQVF